MGVRIKNLDRLLKKLKSLQGDVTAALKEGITNACLLVEKDAKLNVKSSTGALRESITHEVTANDKGVTGVVGTNMYYAPFVELGTGPVGQANQPREATKLGVTYRSTPWVYFSEEMQQFFTTSGQTGKPYLYPALKENMDEVKQLIKDAVGNAIAKLEK